MRRITGDERARVPFAMVAVLVLMLSVFSISYMGGVQRQQAGGRLVGVEVSRQNSILHQVEEAMALEGFYIASKAVAAATQFLCNASMLDRCFTENYSAYLKESFPLFMDPYEVDVRDMVSSIFLEERMLMDLVPCEAATDSNMTLEDGNGTVTNCTVRSLDTITPEELNETSALARYVVVGMGNCTVRNVRSGRAMERPISFERGIDTPFPIMSSKMAAMESAAGNNAMGLARSVKYILTTLAQFRILEGYGSGLDVAAGDTSDLITMGDVQLAVNIAMLIETARLFRDYDMGVAESLEALGMGSGPGTVASLLDRYLGNGTLDPSDIIAIYMGMGERELPVDLILAQALNAIADQFILKYLDYFGIMDIANSVYRTVQKVGNAIDDAGKALSQFILGTDGEDRDAFRQVTEWLARQDTVWPPNTVTSAGILLPNQAPGPTYLAVLDVLQPVNRSFNYSGICNSLTEQTYQPITDADGAEVGTSYQASIMSHNMTAITAASASGYLADFNPASMTRQTPDMVSLWSDFYEQHYREKGDVIYDTLRDAVKNVTVEVSRVITAFIGQKTVSLSGYDDGRLGIDPLDNASVLQSVNEMVVAVIDEAVDHLEANPGAVSALLAALTDKQSQMLVGLMEFVTLNYDIIADRGACLVAATHSLSLSMLLNSSVSLAPAGMFSSQYSLYNELGHSRGFIDDPLPFDSHGTPGMEAMAMALMAQNTAGLASDMAPYAEDAYGKLRDAEAAWHQFGSPQNGLYIKALESVMLAQSGKVQGRFTGRDASGLVGMASGMVLRVLEGIIWSGEVSNTQYAPVLVHSDGSGRMPFRLHEGSARDEGPRWEETFSVRLPGGMLDAVQVPAGHDIPWHPQNTLAIRISGVTGTHYTDAGSFNERPFENRWNVSVRGNFALHVSSSSMPYLAEDGHLPAFIERTIELDLDIPVVAYSGWDLEGVQYASTASIAGDVGKAFDMAMDFLGWVWDTIAGPINWIIDKVMIVVEFFSDILGTLLGYASDVMNVITGIIGFLVEAVQDFLRDLASGIFNSIINWIISLLPDGMAFSFSMFGFDFLVTFGSGDDIRNARDGNGGRIISVETDGMLLGAGMELGLELVVLSDQVAEAADIGYDLLMWSKVNISGFMLDTRIDPFMAVQEHIVECNGLGNGFAMELLIPVVESYDSITYSLHDIPGVGAALSNIPIPFLGLKASVNAGLEIVYTLRGIEADHIVINEVELNPRGKTAGNQWVELYNPSDTGVCLENWTLGSGTYPGLNTTFNSTVFMEPGGYHMVHYPNVTLPTDSVNFELLDPGGRRVDSTPLLSEPDNGAVDGNIIGPMGGQMTWQRSPNGANLTMAGEWAFRAGTIGSENAAVNISFKTLVWNLLKAAFNATWQNLKEQIALSLDFIVKLVTQFIQRFIDDVLRVVARSVVEASLFLDVMLTDMTGSGGGGITLSFVIEGGDTLAAILRWIIDSVSAFLAKFGKPTQPVQYPKLASHIPEHLFIRLDFYGMVQVPAMVKSAVQAGEDLEPVKLTGRIEANIPALAALVGKDMGRWRINFGVYIEKMPAAIADPLFGTGDATPDVWLFKGAVWET